jgi:antagonist of KipI
MSVRVLRPGLLTTVQDAGRDGYAALGIGASGAADSVALRLANALVGNARTEAALEWTLLGPRLQFDAATCVALVGDTSASIDGVAVPAWRPLRIGRGSMLDCGNLRRGARGYLAVAGGLAVAPVLGSRSTDVNAGIGPLAGRALRAGDVLPLYDVEPVAVASFKPAKWSIDPLPWFDFDTDEPLRLLRGTHFADLDAPSRAALCDAEFHIAADSNRVGWRLLGPALKLAVPRELVSSGVAAGTLQLPPGGQAIVLGVEGPTTGGYPRLAHVIAVDLPRLAQRRPGDAVRFALVGLDHAHRLLHEREDALRKLESALHTRLHA